MLEVGERMIDALEWINLSIEAGISTDEVEEMLARYQSAVEENNACEYESALNDLEWILETEIPHAGFPTLEILLSLLVLRRSRYKIL